MSEYGKSEMQRWAREVRALFPWLPEIVITDDGVTPGHAVTSLLPDGRIKVALSPEMVPGRAVGWHEMCHVIQFAVQARVDNVLALCEDAFRARGADPALVAGNLQLAKEQMASMLPEAFIGEWGGYAHPIYGMVGDPANDPRINAYSASLTAEGMRAFFLSLRTWTPRVPAIVSIPTPAAPVPAIVSIPAFVDIRSQLARADWEIGRSTIRIGLAFHHTGSPDLDTTDPVRALQVLARYHRAKDWSAEVGLQSGDGLMYHYAIAGGRTYLCRDIDAVLYATATDANRTHYHCLFLNDPPSAADYEAARSLIALLSVPPTTHRAFGTSTCPGDVITAWVANYTEEEMSRDQFNAWFREQYMALIDPTIVAMKNAYDPLIVAARANNLLDAAQEAAIAEAQARLDRIAEAARG